MTSTRSKGALWLTDFLLFIFFLYCCIKKWGLEEHTQFLRMPVLRFFQENNSIAEETTKLQKFPPYLWGERERGGNEKVMYSNIILKKDLDNRWTTAVETR